MIYIDRFLEYSNILNWSWNEGENISMDDITAAINGKEPGIIEPYGDERKHPITELKSKQWHIGRIIFFIRHPEEIKNIEIDNYCINNYVLPIPIIADGNHRMFAAIWLFKNGKLNKCHCLYGGRMDLLAYLKKENDERPLD